MPRTPMRRITVTVELEIPSDVGTLFFHDFKTLKINKFFRQWRGRVKGYSYREDRNGSDIQATGERVASGPESGQTT